ncbi:MAG: DNA repair protein RadA [Saprospiraceae bacterium]
MSKIKKIFVCSECGATAPKWMGKCSHCGSWNTYLEENIHLDTKEEQKNREWREKSSSKSVQPIPITEVSSTSAVRLPFPDREFNRVIGGGLVDGSIILLGGQPGIGKSTLLLQIALALDKKILYVSGEESEEQIKMRAERIGSLSENCFLITETNVVQLLKSAVKFDPTLLIIDSIQTLSSPHIDAMPGSISQIKECAGELQRFAKKTGISVIIIGHITKDGAIAGPKLLEHIVDVVLQFEGERNYSYRILRTLKNRFGSTDELGIYEMEGAGLKEVSNPSELFLSQKDDDLSGSAVAATMEGMRPMLIEVQALVSPAVYGNPQRSATGFDMRRLNMLLAVLEKRGGLPYGQNDVFLNLAGGIRVEDPGIDLAIVAALISSLEDTVTPANCCFAGEVGLSGEVRGINRIEQRIQEANRLGFEKIFISKYNTKNLDQKRFEIEIIQIGKVRELYDNLFGTQ